MKIRHNAREIEIVCYCRKKTNKSAKNLYSFSALYLNEKWSVNSTFLDSKIQQYYRFISLWINLNTATPDRGYTTTFHSQHINETKQSLVIFFKFCMHILKCIKNAQRCSTNVNFTRTLLVYMDFCIILGFQQVTMLLFSSP